MNVSEDTKTLVIIPAYNEEESLARVVAGVRAAVPGADVVVINDGSHDRTPLIAEHAGATVVSLPYNLGIGAAMQTGFMLAQAGGYQVAVQVDGDGQHDPGEIGVLLERLLAGEADVVVGSRYLEKRGYITPWLRMLGIKILASYVSTLAGQRFSDTTSGFRASNCRALQLCAMNYPADYPEPESLLAFRKMGLGVLEVAVSMNKRYGGQSSITPFWSAYYMIKVILAVSILLLRRAPRRGESTYVP